MSWKPSRFFGVTSGVSYNWLLDKAEFTPQGINLTARNVASQRTFTWETRADCATTKTSPPTLRSSGLFAARSRPRGLRRDLDRHQERGLSALDRARGPERWRALAALLPVSAGLEGMVVAPRRADDTSIVENGAEFYLPSYVLLDAFISTRELYLIPGHETRIRTARPQPARRARADPGLFGLRVSARAARDLPGALACVLAR